MKIIKVTTFTVVFLLSLLFISTKSAYALTLENTLFDVETTINNDSTFTIKEKILYEVNGNFHGLRRDIPLDNSKCTQNLNRTCGGFDRIIPLSVYDIEGRKLNENEYSIYEFEDEDTDERFFRFEREFFKSGKHISGEEFGWIIEYQILGGIEWIQSEPIFYWNMLPPDRSGSTDKSNITIHFPLNVGFERTRLRLYDLNLDSDMVGFRENTLSINLRNIPSYNNFTLSYRFKEGELEKPASLEYIVNTPHFGINIYLDGVNIGKKSMDKLDFIPAGKRTIEISRDGYESFIKDIDFQSGELVSLSIDLEPKQYMSLLLLVNTLIVVCGCIGIPFGILGVFLYYRKYGRDKGRSKTVVPLFSPPKGIRPYLLGTIKDETVDIVDITGTIIDLAYRGYIKITEITKNKNYKLTKLAGKKDDVGLNNTEQKIFEGLFNKAQQVETIHLSKHFPLKFIDIKDSIYKETVSEGFFSVSPEAVRNKYYGIGSAMLVLSFFGLIFISFFIISIIGYFSIFTPAIITLFMGLCLIGIARYMPAKTELGSKVYNEILGFKMYLHTAERFRLQNLGPEEFERYLSYAVVFGIEKEWAKKFEGIYQQTPEWFEGSSSNALWDAMFVSSLVRNFSDSTTTNMIPISTGSSSGSGWSGSSSSFGGFSGGGGGGGSSGGW